MVALDDTVRLITLQFSFSNPDVIPGSIKRLDRETKEEQVLRGSRSNGVLVIEPTEKCYPAEFPKDLEAAGYELVDAFYKERIDAKDPRGRKTYHVARFLFARREFAEPSEELKKARDSIGLELRSICGAMWRVRSFSNPFYKNGEEIPGQRAISVNLEVRIPLFHPDGQPVMAWQKDEKGNRLGDTPLPLKPDHRLRALNGYIQLVAVG